MPVKPTYPGVYVEEISQSLRAITPVSTATAAFVGFTRRGPVNEPVAVRSFADYERIFGELRPDEAVGYAAYQFFGNGGGTAVIVRAIKDGSAQAASVTLESHERHRGWCHDRHDHDGGGGRGRGRGRGRGKAAAAAEESEAGERAAEEAEPALEITARGPGTWGDGLRVQVDYRTRDPHRTFNLHVTLLHRHHRRPYPRESFHGLSMEPDDARFAPAVINARSELIRTEALGPHRPDPSGTISRPFESELPELDVDLGVRIGGVEHEFHLYDPRCDGFRPNTVHELAALLERKLRALPGRPGSHAFSEAEVRVIDRRLQTVAGSLDADDEVRFHGECAGDLGLDEFVHPPARALTGGDDGETPAPGDLVGNEGAKTGIHALDDVDDVNLLNLPDVAGYASVADTVTVLTAAAEAAARRRAFLLVDAPASWTSADAARAGVAELAEVPGDHAALYFPHILITDPVTGRPRAVPPGGAVAGVIARTDTDRGVWKAPAGTAARLAGAAGLTVPLTDRECGLLNTLAVNALRAFPGTGPVVWGARTLDGTSAAVGEQAGEWTYVPVRRLALYVEESLYRGLRWVVFEPNTEQLWQQIRMDAAAYLDTLFRRGAFAGRTPREAYFVHCDATTTSPDDVENGVVHIVVGIAPVTPAEFVVVRIQQMAGQLETA